MCDAVRVWCGVWCGAVRCGASVISLVRVVCACAVRCGACAVRVLCVCRNSCVCGACGAVVWFKCSMYVGLLCDMRLLLVVRFQAVTFTRTDSNYSYI